MTSISIDLGGTRLKSALINNGSIIESTVFPIDAALPKEVCLAILEKEIIRLSRIRRPDAFGLAMPGIINPFECKLLSINGKHDGLLGFDFAKWAQETIKLPFVMENDANAALIGELHYGCGKGCDDAVLMILGTGIGTAAMMNGHLVRGKHFQAGCLGGHISVETFAKGRLCNCGSIGCAETIGSGWAVDKEAKKCAYFHKSGLSTEPVVDYKTILKWEQAGDKLAIRLMNESVDAWSTCAINLIHAYDPDLFILSGGVLNCGTRITAPIAENIKQHAWTPWGLVQLCTAEVPEHSAVLGLHGLLTEKYFNRSA